MEYNVVTDGSAVHQNKTIGIGILSNNRMKGNLVREYCKNITEFYVTDISIIGYEIFYYADTIEELIEQAHGNVSHLLIFKVGMDLKKFFYKFPSWFEEKYNGEVFVGHVLDGKDDYYYIHPQLALIDVNWFHGKTVGEDESGSHTQVAPLRSDENFHDDYTPHWVKPGTENVTFKNKRYGWNLVNEALKTPTGIGVWPLEIRQQYEYLYPEVDEYREKIIDLMNRAMNQEVIYITNTEDIKLQEARRNTEEYKHIIFAPAGGLSASFDAYRIIGYPVVQESWGYALQPDIRKYGQIIIYDKSTVAVKYQYLLHRNWNPNVETMEQYQDRIFPRGDAEGILREFCRGLGNKKEFSEYIENHNAFKNWYTTVYKRFKINFETCDLFDTRRFKRMFIKYIKESVKRDPDRKIIVHFNFSNILQYYPTAFFWNFEDRVWFRGQIIQIIHEIENMYPNVTFSKQNKILMGSSQERFLNVLPWFNENGIDWDEVRKYGL